MHRLSALRRPGRLRVGVMTVGVLGLALIANFVATASGHRGSDAVPLTDAQVTAMADAAAACPALTAARLAGQVMATRYGTMTVRVLDSSGTVLKTLATYSNLDEANGYRQKWFDLASYAGQTVHLRFSAIEDYSRQTSFGVDDTAVDVA